MPNDENRIPKSRTIHQARMMKQIQKVLTPARPCLVIGDSNFVIHSDFEFRHSELDSPWQSKHLSKK